MSPIECYFTFNFKYLKEIYDAIHPLRMLARRVYIVLFLPFFFVGFLLLLRLVFFDTPPFPFVQFLYDDFERITSFFILANFVMSSCFVFLNHLEEQFKSLYLVQYSRVSFDLEKKELLFKCKTYALATIDVQMPLSLIEVVQSSRYFLILSQQAKYYPKYLFVKKNQITYADFERLQEAVPCLQKLKLDPDEFKQETLTDE